MIINKENKTVDMEERDIQFFYPAYIRSFLFYSKGMEPKEVVVPLFPLVDHPLKPGVKIPIRYISPESAEARGIAEDGSNVPTPVESTLNILDTKDKKIQELETALKAANEIIEHIAGQPDTAYEPEPHSGGIEVEEEAEQPKPPVPPLEEEETMEAAVADARFDMAAEARADEASQESTEVPEADQNPKFEPESGATGEEAAEETEAQGINPDEEAAKAEPVPPPPEPPQDTAYGRPDDMHPRSKVDQAKAEADLAPQPEIDESKEKPFEKTITRDEEGTPKVEG